MQQLNADRLVRDLGAVAADVEELVKATAGSTSEAIREARERIESSLRTAKENLKNARQCATDGTEGVARSTDAYMRSNIWKAIGIAGSVGFLLGAIVNLKGARSPSNSREAA